MTDSQLDVQLKETSSDIQKLTSNKEIIAYLAEKFPLCFILEGEAKPLKIGLFQDLAKALQDDERFVNIRRIGVIYMVAVKARYAWIYTAKRQV